MFEGPAPGSPEFQHLTAHCARPSRLAQALAAILSLFRRR